MEEEDGRYGGNEEDKDQGVQKIRKEKKVDEKDEE